MCVSQVGRVIETTADGRAVVADATGSTWPVSLAPLTLSGDAVEPGDWVLVHTGFAVEHLCAADAAELIATLTDLDDGADR